MQYDLQIQALMNEIKVLDESLDQGILPKLAKLEEKAVALHDDYLLGFTYYYYYSFAKYYFDPDRKDFTQYLSRAVHHLMKAEDHEMLARVFNLVAVDAFSYGSYDVAYSFYMHALQEADILQNVVFGTVIETNLSLIFLELRAFKEAKEHIKKAIRIMNTRAEKDISPFSLHAAYVDEAAICLELDDYKAARRALKRALRILPRANAPDEDLKISISMIQLRLAIMDGNTEEKGHLTDLLVRSLEEELSPAGYIGDIRNLCRFLLQENETAIVGRVIEAVSERILSSDKVHAIRMFTTLKIEYATVRGDRKYLKESLVEQRCYLKKTRDDLNKIHSYTLDLVELDTTIRTAQQKMNAEHTRLEQRAYMDALTGIGNRRMVDKIMAEAFERAYRNGSQLGIAFLDVDYFKEYNDTFGHLEGDQCLIAVAKEIERMCNAALPVGTAIYGGRYGGDEFVMIYEGFHEKEILAFAATLCTQIRKLAIPHPHNPISKTVSVSQGICVGSPMGKQKLWEYLSGADEALYKVKWARVCKRPKVNGIHIQRHVAFDTKGA